MQTRGSGWTRGGYNSGARAPGSGPRAHPFALWMHLISHLFVRIAELAITSPSYKRSAICRPIVNHPLRLDSRVINRGYWIRGIYVYGSHARICHGRGGNLPPIPSWQREIHRSCRLFPFVIRWQSVRIPFRENRILWSLKRIYFKGIPF